MTPSPARLALLAGASAVALALAGTGAAEAAGSGGAFPSAAATREDASALLSARERSAEADAVVAGLKRVLTPGHLVDPLPTGASTPTLDALRIDYSDMQRQAAGYRATLGDRHPTLAGATLVLAGLMVQIADETRRILVAAERDAALAHATLDLAERSGTARLRPLSDVTGSVARAAPATASSATLRPAGSGTAAPAADMPAPEAQAQEAAPSFGLARRAAASGGILLAITAALWGAVSRARRVPGPAPRRAMPRLRREPGWLTPAMAFGIATAPKRGPEPRPAPAPAIQEAAIEDAVIPEVAVQVAAIQAAPASSIPAPAAAPEPVSAPPAPVSEPAQATLPVAGRGTPRDVAAAMAEAPDGALARDAARLFATLEAAQAGAARMTVLVVRTADVGADQGDGAALALAVAAAARGRRVALLEARPAGRLRRSTVPAGTAPMVVAAGGTARTAYRFTGGGAVVIVLPGDVGEAEAAAAAVQRHGTIRFDGLDRFDLVVMVGERAAALSRAADLVLVVAGPDTAPEAVTAAAAPCRAMGRLCRTVTLRPTPDAAARPAPQAAPVRSARPIPAIAATRDAAEPPVLRGTFDAEPDRLVA